MSPEIRAHHERNVQAAAALGNGLRPLPAREHPATLAELARVRLGHALRGPRADDLVWELAWCRRRGLTRP